MRITILFLILCILFSCDEGEKKQSGYNCVNGKCTATFDNPTYLTLQDCQTECGSSSVNPTPTPQNGYIYFTVNFDPVCNKSLTLINLGYSSNSVDLDNNIFIEKANQIHYNKYDYSFVKYDGYENKVIICCPKHGEFKQSPHAHLRGAGCPVCKESCLFICI